MSDTVWFRGGSAGKRQEAEVEVRCGGSLWEQRRWAGHVFDAVEVKPDVHGCDGLDTSREGQ